MAQHPNTAGTSFTLPPVIAAPMAGGPSTPKLVNAVNFGFLAWGTCTPTTAREELGNTSVPFGINLFYPQSYQPSQADLEAVIRRLGPDTGTRLPQVDLTAGFAEKFTLALNSAAQVVSSTFGCFSRDEIAALHDSGKQAWITVTTAEHAAVAFSRGADAVVVQGPRAGGHRGTWDPRDAPGTDTLEELLVSIEGRRIAAGGVRCAGDVDTLLALGAEAVACGTAFLLADEAGTSERNRSLVRSDRPSVLSRAFSGRWARGVETDFTVRNPDLPAVYPYLRPMTKDNDYCLAGDERAQLMEAPAAAIERELTPTRFQ